MKNAGRLSPLYKNNNNKNKGNIMICKNEIPGAARLVQNPANDYWEIRLCHDSEPVGPLVCLIHRHHIDLSDVDSLLENPVVPLCSHPYEFIVAVAPNDDLEHYLFSHIRRYPGETFDLNLHMIQCGDVHEMDHEMRHVIYDPFIASVTSKKFDAEFNVSAERLREMGREGVQMLENMDPSNIGGWIELTG